ncbi:MAG: SDR family NAD(P)-dependent oxidoreductase [Deltaproteobacteria bacterium]
MGIFEGKTMLVVGASAGIGAGLASRLAAEGAVVHAAARRRERIEVRAADASGTIVPHACDVTSPASVKALFAAIQEAGAPLDALISTAAVLWFSPFAEQPEDEWTTMLETNLHGSIRITQAALGGMLKRDQGHIIHLTSTAAALAIPHLAIYSAGKAALAHFLSALRGEYGASGVRFTDMQIGNTEGTEGGGVVTRGFDQSRAASIDSIVRWTGMPAMMSVADVVDGIVYALTTPSHLRLDRIVLREKADIPT